MNRNKSVSIILPCHNEADALPHCLEQIKDVINKNDLDAEIIVVNNNSSDNTKEVAELYKDKIPNLILLEEPNIGYGNAYIKGISFAKKENIFMADADASYDFNEIPNFLKGLSNGSDIVIGNRFAKKIQKGVMPHTHKYIGNPILSTITRILFQIKIKDIHCGARAIKKDAYEKLDLQTAGMEFASEMIVLAAKNKLKITEIPIQYHPRIGKSKLNPLSDGWRHLRFLLLNSPLTIFLFPGIILMSIGLILSTLMYFFQINIGRIQLYFHPMFITAIMMIVGYQLIFFSIFSKVYSIIHLNEKNYFLEKLFKHITIEKAGILGIILTLIGILIYTYILYTWTSSNFAAINQVKNSIAALTFIVLGIQTISSAFMLSILSVKK